MHFMDKKNKKKSREIFSIDPFTWIVVLIAFASFILFVAPKIN
jgi:hypothetical protein